MIEEVKRKNKPGAGRPKLSPGEGSTVVWCKLPVNIVAQMDIITDNKSKFIRDLVVSHFDNGGGF